MAYTVIQMITNAYYESGIVGRDFQVPTGSKYNDGLIYLNEVLAKKTIDDAALPYYTQFEFNMVANQETYFIEGLTECELITFYKNEVRFPMWNAKRREYWGSAKALAVSTLPSYFTMDRTLGGSNISVTFSPEQAYPAMGWGLFALNSVTLNQDLSLIFDDYYIVYLRTELAITLCMAFNAEVPIALQTKYMQYDKAIRKRSGVIDLKNTVISTFRNNDTINYAQANIGKGMTTWNRR